MYCLNIHMLTQGCGGCSPICDTTHPKKFGFATYFRKKTFCFYVSLQLFWGWWWRCRIWVVATYCRVVESDDAEVCYARLQPRHWRGVGFHHTPALTCPPARTHTHSCAAVSGLNRHRWDFNCSKKIFFFRTFLQRGCHFRSREGSRRPVAEISRSLRGNKICSCEISPAAHTFTAHHFLLYTCAALTGNTNHTLTHWSATFKQTFPCYFLNSCNKLPTRRV